MILLMVFGLSALTNRIYSDTITSPQIRILDVATKASETRLIPHSVDYRFRPYLQQQNRLHADVGPLKSYVIYDDYPLKIFKEWKANPSSDFPATAQNYLDFAPDFYARNALPPPKPTLAYSSVYSNVIKVFDDSLGGLDRNRFESDRYVNGGSGWKSQPFVEYDRILLRPQDLPRRQPYHSVKLPENFPNVFSPNSKFHFSSFDGRLPQPPQHVRPREGFYNTRTVNYDRESEGNPDEVEILGESPGGKQKRKPFLCSLIRVNQRQFPENGAPCGRSEEELPISLPEYPDYSGLPNDKIPVEHRRQHFHLKRIKRSEAEGGRREKRELGFGYGYSSGWSSPFEYDSGYDGYYPNRGSYHRGFGNNYGSNYHGNRNRNEGYRNTYYGGSRYDEYDDDYQSNDESNSRGLAGYLTNSGRRYKSRRNNNDDNDDDDDDDDNDNNRDNNSDEEMERMNSNRRDTNDRRNNEDSRDRRRNNNNNNNNNNGNNNNNNNNNDNDDDDYRDNRRNNNRNYNRNNNRRYNGNNNSNSRRNNNDRYDYNRNNNDYNNDRYDYYNNNRNRYYGNSNGYGSYGSSYGGYGNGGYRTSYPNNGGYGYGGYGGYGNSFGSF